MNEKITEAHRHRAAYVYVRQSTQHQVRHHHQGRERQYELANRAKQLSKVCNAQSIAATLNRLGFKTGAGKTWRLHSVYSARHFHRLKNHGNSGDWLTVKQAADELLVSQTVIRRLIKEKKLTATQVVEQTPWIIARKSLSDDIVQREVRAVREGRQLKKQNPKQGKFSFK